MCWNNVSLGAAILQSEITGDAMDWAKVTTYLNGKCTSESTYYCESDWGSARYNTALQMAALATTKYSAKSGMDYSSWCKAQMGMILGNNPKNVNFVVGMDSNSAKYPHHRAASGYQSFDEMKGKTGYSSNGHTLVGALVGGPADSNFTYTDSVNDYQANEVALDYNAGLVGAAAGLYSIYKTGSVDSSIEGVSGSIVTTTKATTTTTNKPVTTTTTQATTKQNITTTTITTAAPSGGKTANITTGTQVGTDGDKQMYAEFAPNGAKTATLYYKVKTSDTNSSGAFGTWTGSWEQTDFEVNVGSNGQCTADYVIPSNVGQTVKAMVFYPDASSVKIDKVVLHYGNVTPGTTTAKPSSGGKYTKDINKAIVYDELPAGDKMLGWKWSDLGVPAGEKVTKVEINLSTSKKQIGKWQGAFGSSTSVAPDYWTQSEDMEQTISGKTGSIVWDVDSATSAIIQTQYGGELKFGVWWIDCNKFTIDSITVYTDAYNGSGQITTTVSTTKATTNKTTASTTTTTKQTTTATNGPKPSVKASLYGDVNLDGRVDITDAVLLNKKVAGVVILNDQQYANADCCTDDGVGQADSTVLLQFLVSIVRTLPAEG